MPLMVHAERAPALASTQALDTLAAAAEDAVLLLWLHGLGWHAWAGLAGAFPHHDLPPLAQPHRLQQPQVHRQDPAGIIRTSLAYFGVLYQTVFQKSGRGLGIWKMTGSRINSLRRLCESDVPCDLAAMSIAALCSSRVLQTSIATCMCFLLYRNKSFHTREQRSLLLKFCRKADTGLLAEAPFDTCCAVPRDRGCPC